jgi:hypothetical protein
MFPVEPVHFPVSTDRTSAFLCKNFLQDGGKILLAIHPGRITGNDVAFQFDSLPFVITMFCTTLR